tara:strand:- start:1859 stop:3010 length:1152 start_codon:yes stop_codon:yes gene_type:complete
MKKILVVHNKYRNLGGEDIAVANEITLLKQYFRVEELYFENTIKNPIKQLIYFLINRNIESKKILSQKIENFEPDLIYIHNTWFKASISILEKSIESKAEVVLKVHNFRYFCTRSYTTANHFDENENCHACGLNQSSMGNLNKYFQESFIKSLLVSRYGKKYFNILKKGDIKIAVLTNFHKNFMEKLDIPGEKIYVFPNHISQENSQVSTSNKENYLVYAGRISKEKGVDNLIQEFLSIEENNFNLKIIGEGPLKKQLVNKYNSHKIEFIDLMENSEVLKLISNSRGIVTATRLYEGQPTLLCEASSLGVPSIFPMTGGILEFFPNNYKLGFEQFEYLDLRNKMRELIFNENLDQLGQENKDYINEYLDKNNLILKFKEMTNL